MIIRKRPIISWLLNIDNVEDEGKFGVPMLSNKQHFGYLANGLKFLSDVRQTQPDWGLPELLMPSFEVVMKKSAKSFYGIDHQLFQEFYKDNVCGILLSRDCGTIVYGFGEDTLHVWLFREDGGISNLYMYFYIESTKDNVRHIYTWPTLTADDQLFAGNKEEREQIYERLANKLMVYLAVKKYVKVETIIVPVGTTAKLDDKILGYKSKEKVRNESGQEVIVMDSRWFRKIVNDNEIFVRGFFRFQNKKDEKGEWYKELIFVDSFVRHGYHRNALIEEENNSKVNGTILTSKEYITPTHTSRRRSGSEHFKELWRCPRLQEAVGVGVYKSYNSVVVFRVGVAQPPALYDLALAQREFHGLDAVALAVVCRQDNAVHLGVILALEHAMVKAASLCLESLYGIKHRYFNVVVADDNPEVAGLFPIEVRLFRLGSQHLLLTPALLRRLVPFVQPMVMGGFEVLGADILGVVDVLSALLQQADGIAPQTVVGRVVMMPCSHLVRLPTFVQIQRATHKISHGLQVLGLHHRLYPAVRQQRLHQPCRMATVGKPAFHAVAS